MIQKQSCRKQSRWADRRCSLFFSGGHIKIDSSRNSLNEIQERWMHPSQIIPEGQNKCILGGMLLIAVEDPTESSPNLRSLKMMRGWRGLWEFFKNKMPVQPRQRTISFTDTMKSWLLKAKGRREKEFLRTTSFCSAIDFNLSYHLT